MQTATTMTTAIRRVVGSRTALSKTTANKMTKNCTIWYIRTSCACDCSMAAEAKTNVPASWNERRRTTRGMRRVPKSMTVAPNHNTLISRSHEVR